METKNIIGYLRVSTDEQANKGHSIPQQEEALISYCKKMNYNIIKIYKEDHTAKHFNRPEWKQLMTFVKANKNQIDKVLFMKWDRFSRSSEHAYPVLAEFRKMGIELNAVEQPLDFSQPISKIMLAVNLSTGEVERDYISDRTMLGTRKAKKDGYFCGQAPYGYDNHRDEFKMSILKPNHKAVLVKMAFEEVAKGIEPIENIRKRLSKLGMTLKKSAFNDMLKNITYAGKIIVPEFQKEPMTIVSGKFEPLIDLETFNRVQYVFRGKRWFGLKPSHINLDFPMRGFLTCEKCGGEITGSTSKGRSKRYGYYHCRHKCSTRVSTDQTHDFISEQLVKLQINNNVKELFKDVLIDFDNEFDGNRAKQLETVLNKQKTIKESIIEAEDMLLSKKINSDHFSNMVNRLNADLMKLNNEIEVLSTKSDSLKGYVNEGLELLVSLDKLFLEGDYEDKRILAGSLFPKKLFFGNEGCRTAEVNEVAEVLGRFNKGFGGGKKEKAAFLGDFSATVPYGLNLSNFIEDFNRIRKLKSFMEIGQL